MLILGTHNRKKGREMAELLAPLGIRVWTLADVPDAIEVVEDGDSFAANARLKATRQALHLARLAAERPDAGFSRRPVWVLGEDSGIEVDALGGAPGIYSARYSESATDEANNAHLLAQLGDTPLDRRTARYVCHMTLADPQGEARADVEESCRGRIRFQPAGAAGFGYDPLFEIVEYHKTFGELGEAVKSVISHRGRAMRRMAKWLVGLLDGG